MPLSVKRLIIIRTARNGYLKRGRMMSWYARAATAVIALSLLGNAIASAEQPPSAPPKKPAATSASAKPVTNPLTERSVDFWTDAKKTQASQSFNALKAAVTCNCTVPAVDTATNATAKGETRQRIVDVAITNAADTAKVLSAAGTVGGADSMAVATVLNMTTSSAMRAEAAALVEPEVQARVQEMTANLSTGIAGLPGIYLSDSPIQEPRGVAPSGYTPVSGSSIGCSAR